ncbi:MAG: hypothetical protein AM326_10950 [Candidatus Thorarchaeota archaeon SMTZ-45]|nr:MAG: hypothetical protein AM326_10950 [Candidatus Thorarchaeota archaeon SMTZ-45]
MNGEGQVYTADAINPLDVDSTLMAKMIFAEDAGGGPQAWIAVGNAALNRLKSGRYGKSLSQVIKGMSSAIQTKSPQWQKADNLEFNDFEQRVFNKIKDVTDGLVSGKIPDTIKGATHFENLNRFPLPYWAKDMDAVARVGRHTYFREKPRLDTKKGE